MGVETKTLSSYLAKRIQQLKNDHARLDLEKASDKAILRLQLEENDIRECIEAIKALEVAENRNAEIFRGMQHQINVRDRRLQEAQVNVNLIMESYSRTTRNEDNMLKWIMDRRVKNA